MGSGDLLSNLETLWEHNPGAIALLAVGFLIFLFLVVDAWRHKRHHKHRK